jgi:tRNA threonylcarbamoyladenosine biosynthesis protein TsaE
MSIESARTSGSPAETEVIGKALGHVLRAGEVVLLEGELGAGKTALVRAVAEGMGLTGAGVSSPTFVMIHEYRGESRALIHVDSYRLRGPEELESLGWDAVMARVEGDAPEAALIVEWPERLGPGFLRGREVARIRIEHAGEESRELFLSLPDSWRGREGLEDLLARRATRCPVTGARVEPDCPTYPFASERARMADLHRWFSGGYSISRPAEQADFDEPEPRERDGHG